jgi:hypothetical protein
MSPGNRKRKNSDSEEDGDGACPQPALRDDLAACINEYVKSLW